MQEIRPRNQAFYLYSLHIIDLTVFYCQRLENNSILLFKVGSNIRYDGEATFCSHWFISQPKQKQLHQQSKLNSKRTSSPQTNFNSVGIIVSMVLSPANRVTLAAVHCLSAG